MAKPKKPKKLKMPKKPKSKTIASMKTYLARRKDVEAENNRREKKYKSDLKEWETLKNKVARA